MKQYMMGLMAMATMSMIIACNNDAEPEAIRQTGEIRFMARMDNGKRVSVGGNAWEGGELLQVKMNGEEKTYKVSDNTGAMTTDDAQPFLWKGDNVQVNAWTRIDGQLNLKDQSSEANLNAKVMLKSDEATATDKHVSLQFKHQMTRVQYQWQSIKNGTFTPEEIAAARISFIGYGAVTSAEGVPAGVGEANELVTPFITSNEGVDQNYRSGEALMCPCEMWEKPMIQVEIAGKVLVYTPSRSNAGDVEKNRGVLVKGAVQKYYLAIDKDKLNVKMELVAGNIDAFDMSESDKGQVEFEPTAD